MAKPTVEIQGLDEVKRLLAEMPEALFLETKKTLAETTLTIQRNVILGFNGDASISLQTRTGNLQRSIKTENRGKDLSTLRSSVFTNSIYAPIHEEGGTIKEKNAFKALPGGPYLAIPSDMNKTAAGVTRFSPTDAFNLGADLRQIRNPRKAQFMIVEENVGPLFWLVPEVIIKARLGMQDETDKQIPILINELTDNLLERFIMWLQFGNR